MSEEEKVETIGEKAGKIRGALLAVYQSKGRAEMALDESEKRIAEAVMVISGLENQLSVLEPLLQAEENGSTIEIPPDGGSNEE